MYSHIELLIWMFFVKHSVEGISCYLRASLPCFFGHKHEVFGAHPMCSWQPHLQIPLLWWWLQATHLTGAGGVTETCVMGSSGVPLGVVPSIVRGGLLGVKHSLSAHSCWMAWLPGCPAGMSQRWLLVLYAQHWRMSVIFLLSV